MNFEESMHFVEQSHTFPRKPQDRHGMRSAWLLMETGLARSTETVPHVIVAGSCGKASTAMFLAYIISELFHLTGVKKPVGLGIKPPLDESPEGNRERYQLLLPGHGESQWITEKDFISAVSYIAPAVKRYDASPHLGEMASYDLRLAVLSRFFVSSGAGFGIFEANIGLRDDGTSAFTSPSAIALCPIGEAHLDQLAPPPDMPEYLRSAGSLAGPIHHKAGGLKKGVPALIGRQKAMGAILAIARQQGAAPVHYYGNDFSVLHSQSSLSGTRAFIAVGKRNLDIRLSAPGDFQVENALLAAATADMLQTTGILNGSAALLDEAIKAAVRKVNTHGRLQILTQRPTVIISSAAAAIKWKSTVSMTEELMEQSGKNGLIIAATFMTRDENARKSLDILLTSERLKALIAVSCPDKGDTTYQSPQDIALWCRERRPGLPCLCMPAINDAHRYALSIADPDKDAVLLLGKGTGSICERI